MDVHQKKEQTENTKTALIKIQHRRKKSHFNKKSARQRHLPIKTPLDHEENPSKSFNALPLTKDGTISLLSFSSDTKKCVLLDLRTDTDPSLFLNDYTVMSNANFKDILSSTLATETEKHALLQIWNHAEQQEPEGAIVFTRQLAHLINRFNYLQLQYDQWTYYYELGHREHIWHGRVSKHMAQLYSMCSTYGRSKLVIEQRRQKYQQELKHIQNEIDETVNKAPTWVDTNQLMTMVSKLVHQDQHLLRIEMERRKHRLKSDANDHRLMETFYQLRPRLSEIHSARQIWKATFDEQTLRSEIEIFQMWCSSRSPIISCTFHDLKLTNLNGIVTQVIFDQYHTRPIEHWNRQLNFTVGLSEESLTDILLKAEQIAHIHTQKIADEKVKLLDKREKMEDKKHFNCIISTIEQRAINILQRIQYDTKQKLKMIYGNATSIGRIER